MKLDLNMIYDDFLSTPLSETPFTVFDVETTGLSAKYNNIIEIGCIKIENLQITNRFSSFINPAREIPYYITQITGISNNDVYDAPLFSEVAYELRNFMTDTVLVAHNISFDHSFLRKEFLQSEIEELPKLKVCTVKLARKLYPFLRSKNLSSVATHLRIKNPDVHRAYADADVTAKILIKMINELETEYGIKTIGELISFQFAAAEGNKKSTIKKSLLKSLATVPDTPGIYYFLNKKEEIIYIGKGKSLQERLKSYFTSSSNKKAKKIINEAAYIRYEITNSEMTALITEAETIKEFKPKHNRQLKNYTNKYFIKFDIVNEFVKPIISMSFDFDGADYFGPFSRRTYAENLIEIIDRTFLLRECDEKEFQKKKGCFLMEIERCTAPCLNFDKPIYNEELNKVYNFLYGKNIEAVTRLINKMKFYSENEKYEKAGEVKDLINLILSQTFKSAILAEPVNKTKVLIEINEKFSRDYLLLIEGKIYLKEYAFNKKDSFEDALDDFFEGNILRNNSPDEEDLEKLKITLNWLIKNREQVRLFYLKDFESKEELYSKLTKTPFKELSGDISVITIKDLVNK